MAYKFYTIHMNELSNPPKTDYHEEMQAIVNDQFYNSSDWYTIQEETSFSSGVYSDLDVRINAVVNTTTGANQGDDWRKLVFKDISKSVRIGAFFVFDNNTWVTINTEVLSNLTSTCTVRRCNNTLRWYDANTVKQSFPCVLDYGITENRDYSTGGSKLVNPSGLLQVTTQLNAVTNLIVPNDRFLFGNPSNWTTYKVQGGGIHNFNNPETETFSVTGLLKLTTSVVQLNTDTDDTTLGYPDASGTFADWSNL